MAFRKKMPQYFFSLCLSFFFLSFSIPDVKGEEKKKKKRKKKSTTKSIKCRWPDFSKVSFYAHATNIQSQRCS